MTDVSTIEGIRARLRNHGFEGSYNLGQMSLMAGQFYRDCEFLLAELDRRTGTDALTMVFDLVKETRTMERRIKALEDWQRPHIGVCGVTNCPMCGPKDKRGG